MQNELYQELCQQGLALIESKCSKEALSYFKKALETKTDDYKVYYYQGLALHRLGCWEKALSSYDSALKIKWDCCDVWCERGYTLSILGRHEEAIVSYYKALEIEPDCLEAQNKREIALRGTGKRFTYPLAPLDLQLTPCPKRSNQNDILSELNQCNAEIASYDSEVEEIEIYPPQLQLLYLWLGRSDALLKLERYSEAVSSYETALGIMQGKSIYEFACRTVISIRPKALHNQGVALYYLGQLERAIGKFNEAIEQSWNYPDPLYGRALSFIKLEQLEEAISSLDKALKISPCYSAAWYMKGTLFEKLGFSNEAISCHNKALDISRAFNNQKVELLVLERLRMLQDPNN